MIPIKDPKRAFNNFCFQSLNPWVQGKKPMFIIDSYIVKTERTQIYSARKSPLRRNNHCMTSRAITWTPFLHHIAIKIEIFWLFTRCSSFKAGLQKHTVQTICIKYSSPLIGEYISHKLLPWWVILASIYTYWITH